VKLKQDFVTNSSSTSYVALIPKDFKLEDHFSILEQMGIRSNIISEEYIDEFNEFFDFDIPKEERVKFILNNVKHNLGLLLSKKEVVLMYEMEDDLKHNLRPQPTNGVILGFLKELDLIVLDFPSDSEDGKCVIVPEEAFDKLKLKNIGKRKKK
jgi:hypothetical protein